MADDKNVCVQYVGQPERKAKESHQVMDMQLVSYDRPCLKFNFAYN